MKKRGDRLGEKFLTREGYVITIVDYIGSQNCIIQFDDGTTLGEFQYDLIKRGSIKNPLHRSKFGVGYIGIGKYKSSEKNKLNKCYSVWQDILDRCYSSKFKQRFPAYKDCTLDEEWHNFQNFAEWWTTSCKTEDMKNWHVDKDFLVEGNKVYSSSTCTLLPVEINNILLLNKKKRGELPLGLWKYKDNKRFRAGISVNKKTIHLGIFDTIEDAFEIYKKNKEFLLKESAEKYKGLIDTRVYDKLINYEVKINF